MANISLKSFKRLNSYSFSDLASVVVVVVVDVVNAAGVVIVVVDVVNAAGVVIVVVKVNIFYFTETNSAIVPKVF